jgi:hypothetical protein
METERPQKMKDERERKRIREEQKKSRRREEILRMQNCRGERKGIRRWMFNSFIYRKRTRHS